MTGFLALLDLEGRPLAPARAAALAAGLRGPGRARPRWVCRGGALVAATEASSATRRVQGAGAGGPFQTRRGLLLAGDVRLDAPDAVAERLGLGRGGPRRPAHAELVLRLYQARGESALDALAGDFAFVLVDLRARRLLAQRDAFGVRPLFVARAGGQVLVGNVAAALAAHPGVDDAPDEDAVADFLLAGHRGDRAATYLRGLRRVPPAERLVVADGRARRRRVGAPRPPSRPLADRHVVDAFAAGLERAVRVRAVPGRTALLMSGGLDSTAVAFHAAGAARRAGAPAPAAVTCGAPGGGDEEIGFAGRVARALGLAWRPLPGDGWRLGPAPAAAAAPGPRLDLYRGGLDPLAEAARDADVVLTGYGGDPLLRTSPEALRHLARREPAQALARVVLHLRALRRLPGLGLRAGLRARRAAEEVPALPAWLAPDWARERRLAERLRALAEGPRTEGPGGADHPGVAELLAAPVWTELFEGLDPASTGLDVELRHPFCDRALAELVLAIPPLPWCADKHVLRCAMLGRLPEPVRRRPKTPLAPAPPPELAPGAREAFRARLRAVPELGRFVDVAALERALEPSAPPGSVAACLPALALADWLHARAARPSRGAAHAPAPRRIAAHAVA